jgi:hypothetical protein
MPTYSLQKRPDSCSVEKELLLELEGYIRRKAGELDVTPERGRYEVIIDDSIGKEELHSVDEFRSLYFPNGTRSIMLTYRGISPNLELTVKFSKDYLVSSSVEIAYTGESARETAIEISARIDEIIRPYKTPNLFHPNPMIFSILCTALVMMFSFLTGNLVTKAFRAGALLAVPTLAIGWYLLAGFLRPYSAFKTRRNEDFLRWHRWLTMGIIGTILFGVIFARLVRNIFG